MIEYKGFNIPENAKESVKCISAVQWPFRVTLYNSDKTDAVITQVPIEELEDAFALQDSSFIDKVIKDFKAAIDDHVAAV